MSYAKPSLSNAHGLHDASLLQMMTKTMASEETAVAVDSLSIDDSSARRVAHYRQCSLAQRMTMHHQHQSPSTTGHYLTAFGRQTSRFSRGYRRFISRAPLTNRHRINCRNRLLLPLFRYSTFHILAFLSILLLHSTPPISCLDSFNDLEEIQTSLCDAYGSAALGMESGTIPDSMISASSSYNEQSVGPQNARLNRELNGGAWCPATQLDSKTSGKEWIQVNFSEPYVITKIATQGRFGNGMGLEYSETFWLHYTRDGITWIQWRNKYGEHEIPGNMDTYSIVESIFPVPLVGVTAIRLLPISQHMRTCCVRFEVYGCPYKDGPISYTMMDGNYKGRFGDLIDHTYDGYRRENGFLAGGLGQLIDGIKGDDNYKVNKGFEWIGWKSNNNYGGHMSITFEFTDIRNFTLAKFHCNNIFSKEMAVFHSAKIWFSLDGVQWAQQPEDFGYMPDKALEKARDVIVHLHHRVGRFIKFDLMFAPNSRWLLISEVRLESKPITSGVPISELVFVKDTIGPITTTPITSTQAMMSEPFILLICAIVGFLVVFFVLFFFFLARKRKEKITGSEYTTVPMKDVVSTPLYCEPQDYHRMSPFSHGLGIDPEYAVPDVIGNGAISTMLTINGTKGAGLANGITMSPRTFRPIQPTVAQNAFAFLANTQPPPPLNQDDGNARYYASTDVLARSNLLTFEQPSDPTSYAMDTHKSAGADHFLMGTNKINPMMSCTPSPPIKSGSQIVASSHHSGSPPSSLSSNSSRILKTASHGNGSDGFDGYENTQIHSSSTKTPSPVAVPAIPALKDTEISVIDGQFGYSKFGDCELGYLLRKNEKKLVILKTLAAGSEQFREEFLEEMSEKWRLSSKCIDSFATFHGYVSKHDYLAMVIEYGDVDLKKYLRTATNVRFTNLIEIASQVAEGMQDLHSRGFIHRDLAARNCLIYTANMQVKISDSGAFIGAYKKEYFNEVLPVRWMSHESLLQGKFTAKSDVFSFGATLWEIMNYCKMLPHEQLTETELISEIINENKAEIEESNCLLNASTFYNHPFSDSSHEYAVLKSPQLPQPKECSTEIYDLILECTKRNENSRPEFHEIAYFLKKKCMNFRKI